MFEIDLDSFIFNSKNNADFYIIKRIFMIKFLKNIKLELLFYILKVHISVIWLI